MRVVVGERVGGPEVLGVAERAAPRPGPGEIAVDVAAAGVNFMDIYERKGAGEGAGAHVVYDGVVKEGVRGRMDWAQGRAGQ